MTPEKQIEEQAANPLPRYNDVPPVRFGEHDDFDREIIADNIIKLLDSDLTDCYPMAIDGGWGTGKSEFCHKLINKMRDNAANYKTRNVIYFDAFEAENVEEPLLSLLAKITEVVPESEKESLRSKIAPVVRYGLKITLKGLVSHTLRQNADDIADGLRETIEEESKTIIDGLLKEYSQAKANVDALKKCIENAVVQKELVIFVDELDRCRPDFALNVFELVKHVFDIEGVKFIFVINSNQIKAMISHRYGHDVETDVYLEKFIKFSITLPRITSKYQEFNVSARYYELELLKLQKKHLVGRRNYAYQFISDFIKNKNISLRGVEKLSFSIKLYTELCPTRHLNSPIGDLGWSLFTVAGILIFTFDKNLSEKIIKNTASKNDIYEFFGVESRKTDIDNWSVIQLMSEILAFETVPSHLKDVEYTHDQQNNIQTKIKQLFEVRYSPPREGILTILIDIIQTLNFCG